MPSTLLCMDQFQTPISTLSDKRNASMHLSCDLDEDLAATAPCWSVPTFGFTLPVNEQMGVVAGGFGKVEEENDSHHSLGLRGCEMKELAGGMRIPGSCTYLNSAGGYPAAAGSPSSLQSALQNFRPSNNDDDVSCWLTESMAEDVDFSSCDEFRIYEFKVRKCMRGRSHDWTECPFAHPGEKARRRDPRRFQYSGSACPDFRKGNCRKGDTCEYAHGVFECWLHPSRYRTQLCKDGKCCTRKVCFFAHTPSQLRLFRATSTSARPGLQSHQPVKAFLNCSYDGSPVRQALAGMAFDGLTVCDSPESAGLYDGSFDTMNSKNSHLGVLGKVALGGFCGASQVSSPTSTLEGHSHSPPPLSPPLSPSESPPMSPNSPCWNNALAHRRISSLSAAQVLHRQTVVDPHVALLQVQCPLAQSSSPVAGGARGLSPLSSNAPVNRRYLERLNSMPTVPVYNCVNIGDHNLSSFPKELHSSQPQTMTQLISTLQQLELKHAVEASKGKGQSLLSSRQLSRSVPGSPHSRLVGQAGTWDVKEPVESPLEKVESGRELRAKIYGRLGKEVPPENEIPDLGWVNELVK